MHHDPERQRERGMTLVETMVAMGLMSAVLGVFLPMLTTSMKMTRPLQTQSATVDELRRAMSSISRELRSAECISEPDPEDPPSNVLRFTTYANDSTAYEVTYTATAGKLVRQVTGQAEQQVVGDYLVNTADAFQHIATPRRTAKIQFHVQLEPTAPVRDVGTVIAGRNAWRKC